MADTQGTPNSAKPAVKPPQYQPTTNNNTPGSTKADRVAAAKADQPAASAKVDQPVAKADQATTATTATAAPAATVKTDKPVPRFTAITIRIDPESADILRVEGVDSTGARHELSEDEKKSLVLAGGRAERLSAVVEEAFEAGIASVLGDGEEEDTEEESPEEAEIRRELLAPLMARSAIRRLSDRTTLNRAILGTLLEHSIS